MKKGDIVMIYQDPVTEQKLEGKAELLKFIGSNGQLDENSILETWQVKFLDDDMVTTRSIKTKV